MSKLNIIFNNKTFALDETALAEVKASIKAHLSSNMSGSGATIKFDGVSYNIDLTKLSTAEDIFAAYLSEVSGGISDSGYYIEDNELGGQTLYITDVNAVLTLVDNEFGGQTAMIN